MENIDLIEMVENEYALFLKDRLPFEIIYPDNYHFLLSKGMIDPDELQKEIARRFVRQYRIELLRNNPLCQDEFKTLDREPATREDRLKNEEKIRSMLIEKSLVYNFYVDQSLKSVKRIFPHKLNDIEPK